VPSDPVGTLLRVEAHEEHPRSEDLERIYWQMVVELEELLGPAVPRSSEPAQETAA
jgi:hypothetical protein